MSLTIEKVKQHPFQCFWLNWFDAVKMFFWESTQIGYVTYPAGLTKLFAWAPFKNGLRLVISLLTLFAVVYLLVLLWRGRNNLLEKENPLLLLYLSLLFVFSFICSYSIFWIIPRYALPIASLYLIIIVYVIQRTLCKPVLTFAGAKSDTCYGCKLINNFQITTTGIASAIRAIVLRMKDANNLFFKLT